MGQRRFTRGAALLALSPRIRSQRQGRKPILVEQVRPWILSPPAVTDRDRPFHFVAGGLLDVDEGEVSLAPFFAPTADAVGNDGPDPALVVDEVKACSPRP